MNLKNKFIDNEIKYIHLENCSNFIIILLKKNNNKYNIINFISNITDKIVINLENIFKILSYNKIILKFNDEEINLYYEINNNISINPDKVTDVLNILFDKNQHDIAYSILNKSNEYISYKIMKQHLYNFIKYIKNNNIFDHYNFEILKNYLLNNNSYLNFDEINDEIILLLNKMLLCDNINNIIKEDLLKILSINNIIEIQSNKLSNDIINNILNEIFKLNTNIYLFIKHECKLFIINKCSNDINMDLLKDNIKKNINNILDDTIISTENDNYDNKTIDSNKLYYGTWIKDINDIDINNQSNFNITKLNKGAILYEGFI